MHVKRRMHRRLTKRQDGVGAGGDPRGKQDGPDIGLNSNARAAYEGRAPGREREGPTALQESDAVPRYRARPL